MGKIVKLGEIANYKTGKLNSNAAVSGGKYPFFTCSRETYRTNTYSFDCECVLLAGNNANAEYPVKYFNGKFDAYQRTYVITPKDLKQLNIRFLFYAIELKLNLLKSLSTGSATRFLTKGILDNLEFDLPLLVTQQKIVSILSAYDDLIENNYRRITILEEMARSLYREWFVKFRFPGHEEVKMVDSELGQIPEGWNLAQISDIYKTSSGGTPSRLKPEYYNGDIQWIKTKELRDGFVIECEETISELGLIKSSAKLFPIYAVLMAMYGATIGQLGIISKESASNQACCAIIAIDEIFSPWYIYLNLLSNRTYIIGQRMGAAQQNISQQIIKDLKVIQPDSQTMQKFNQIVESIFLKIENLQKKNNNLKTQRDMLLPKLISGKIEV